jgi:hypothetical protein
MTATTAAVTVCRWCGGELTRDDDPIARAWMNSGSGTWRHAATNRVICKGLMRLAEPVERSSGDDGE